MFPAIGLCIANKPAGWLTTGKSKKNLWNAKPKRRKEQIDRKYLYFEHTSFSGVFYAQPVRPELKRALHARAWILGIGELDELEKTSDEEIIKCLPVEVA